MCFSATASFTAAGALATIGTMAMVTTSKRLRLVATIPLIFAIQQLLEGVVWITLTTGDTHSLIHQIGVTGFLFFAGIFWPIWIPLILNQLEHNHKRKQLLRINLWGGILIAAFSGFLMTTTEILPQIVTHHISYPLLAGPFEHYFASYGEMGYHLFFALYIYVTIGSSFISTVRFMWILGLLSGIGFMIAQLFYAYALGSIWCYFAAIISAVTYFFVKRSP